MCVYIPFCWNLEDNHMSYWYLYLSVTDSVEHMVLDCIEVIESIRKIYVRKYTCLFHVVFPFFFLIWNHFVIPENSVKVCKCYCLDPTELAGHGLCRDSIILFGHPQVPQGFATFICDSSDSNPHNNTHEGGKTLRDLWVSTGDNSGLCYHHTALFCGLGWVMAVTAEKRGQFWLTLSIFHALPSCSDIILWSKNCYFFSIASHVDFTPKVNCAQ